MTKWEGILTFKKQGPQKEPPTGRDQLTNEKKKGAELGRGRKNFARWGKGRPRKKDVKS